MSLFVDSHAITVTPGEDTFPPRLGVHSLLREAGAAVTASAETTSGEKENAYKEGLTYDFWRPGVGGVNWLRCHLEKGAQAANYVGIAAHDLHLYNASVKMQHSTDGGATWTDSSSAFSPGSSAPILILYDDTFAADHRLHITTIGAPSIGVVNFGRILKLTAPIAGAWTPPHLARANRYVTEISEGGAFLGRSLIANGASLALEIDALSMPWLRAEWEGTVRLLETRGFFFAARDLADYGGVAAAEVFYGYAVGQPAAQYASNVYGRLNLDARGIVT